MRFPSAAGRFYPSDPDELRSIIKGCMHSVCDAGVSSEFPVKAVVSPHAGYMFSGSVAAHSFKSLMDEDRTGRTYVVIGPDHHGTTMRANVMCDELYLTPLGECPVDECLCEALSKHIPVRSDLHALDHSIENQIPFIQYIDPDARIVPVLMGDQSICAASELTQALGPFVGDDVVVVASSDMNHFLPQSQTVVRDRAILETIMSGDVASMYSLIRDSRSTMCGYGPTAVAMGFGRADGYSYATSYDTAGYDPDSVVGYASIIFR